MYLDKLYDSFKQISKVVQYGDLQFIDQTTELKNKSNDCIKKIDLLSHDYIVNNIREIPNIMGYISEESEDICLFDNKMNTGDSYLLAFDPIDGSKNILANITVGTIYILYKFDLETLNVTHIVEAGYCLYGPRTIMVKTNNNIVEQFSLTYDDIFKKDRNISFNDNDEKIYSINESNRFSNELNDLIKYYKANNYNQRWVGSMVADCHQILSKGGIFMYPSSEKYSNGKLRLLYEVLPFSYIFKIAGGVGIDNNNIDILETYKNYKIELKNIHKSIPIILCSKKEYDVLINFIELRDNIFC